MVYTCLPGIGVAGGRDIRLIKDCHIHVVCVSIGVYGCHIWLWEEGDGSVFNLSRTCIVTGVGVRDVGQGKEWEGRSIQCVLISSVPTRAAAGRGCINYGPV